MKGLLKGLGPPIIKGTGLYRLILVWRGFIMTVHTVVWVITLIIRFCCSIYHEILRFPRKLNAFCLSEKIDSKSPSQVRKSVERIFLKWAAVPPSISLPR